MHKAHVIKLKPTKAQELFFIKSCGVARFTYNWALAKRKEDYEKGIKWGTYDLVKHLNSIKREQFPWMLEVGKTCCQYPIHNLHKAYKRMWGGIANYPKFKKKGRNDSFIAVENAISFKQKDFKIWIPRLGWVKCCENLRFEGKVYYIAIRRRADMWFAIIHIDSNETPTVSKNQTTVGVDVGIKNMITLSDGTVFENPMALKSNIRRLKIRQRRLSKKKEGSKNRHKAKMRLARHYYRITNIRKTAIHQATRKIVDNCGKIVVECLNVRGMVKNKCLAPAIGDSSFGEIIRQLQYKALWQGKEVVKADRFFASSKTCSNCGKKKETLKLSERTFNCECGLSIDRDLNAAKNLASYSPTCELQESYAFGGRSSAFEQSLPVNEEILSNISKQLV